MAGDILLQPGSLRSALERTAREALRRGALRPIETEQLVIDDAGVRFLVRMVSSLRRKEAERRSGAGPRDEEGRARNPFLPPEPELTVSQVSRSHLAVLNKFNVLDRHLLIVTRRFEHQETLLTPDDFRALLACMDEYPMPGVLQRRRRCRCQPAPQTPAAGAAAPRARWASRTRGAAARRCRTLLSRPALRARLRPSKTRSEASRRGL